MVIDDLGKKYGVPVFRTKVGEINVVEKMLEVKAIIGGEGNGGVIWPEIHPCRDSFTAAGLVLEALVTSGKKLSTLAASFPRYFMIKEKISCPTELAYRVVLNLKNRYEKEGENISTLDGLKILWPDSWVHLRPSNTEPIIRIIAEARSQVKVKKLVERFRREIKETIKKLS